MLFGNEEVIVEDKKEIAVMVISVVRVWLTKYITRLYLKVNVTLTKIS